MPAEITDEEIQIELRGAPDWITVELIRDTLDTWQAYYAQQLTIDDAKEILLNVTNLYQLLMEIDQKESDAKRDHR